jgi:hydrogenase/urease accessory protein HupE
MATLSRELAEDGTVRSGRPSLCAIPVSRKSAPAWLSAALVLLMAAGVQAHAVDPPALPSLGQYFRLGVEHILGGFDHLVFLVGVVLITRGARDVLLAVSAFTLAHSITLALAVLEIATLSPRLVEPLIALSVAYVGIENFLPGRSARRYRLTFAFGLVHGFGFAGALREIGLPREQLAAALGWFNVGVEAGQLLVLAGLLPLLAWLRLRERGFLYVSRSLNVALVLLGVGWALERSLSEPAPTIASDVGAPPREPQGALLVSASAGLRSVYAAPAPRSELAAELCEATQRLPRERRAACTGGAAGVTLERECTRVLSAALASPALVLSPAKAKKCIASQRARYERCDFSAAVALPPLPECSGLWNGQLAAGASCRSSLECGSGLHCHGLSPLDPGVCGEPKPEGASCGQGADPLAAYVPNRGDDTHPECSGLCKHGRCSR